jgi:hypothetical protein
MALLWTLHRRCVWGTNFWQATRVGSVGGARMHASSERPISQVVPHIEPCPRALCCRPCQNTQEIDGDAFLEGLASNARHEWIIVPVHCSVKELRDCTVFTVSFAEISNLSIVLFTPVKP